MPFNNCKTLAENTLHLWIFNREEWQSIIDRFSSGYLHENERDKALEYKIEDDRQRFLVGRIMLRKLSCHYLQCRAGALLLQRNKYGKPFWENNSISFNISHSGDWVAIGFSDTHPIGIDIQRYTERKPVNIEKISDFAFHLDEMEAVKTSIEEANKELFYHLWTRKEAYIKALGMGLFGSLKGFSTYPFTLKQWQCFQGAHPDINDVFIYTTACDSEHSLSIAFTTKEKTHNHNPTFEYYRLADSD